MDITIAEPRVETAAPRGKPLLRGIHHLALVTGDMRMTLDFYVRVLGMPLVHGLRTPSPPPNAAPAHGVGSPPHKNILHYFLDMGGDSLLAFSNIRRGSTTRIAIRSARCSTFPSCAGRSVIARCSHD